MLKKLCLLLSMALAFIGCKETTIIGTVMVLNKGVKLHAAPHAQAKILSELKRNQEYAILKKDIPDEKLKNRVRWYLIKTKEAEGYLSYDNEKLRNDIYAYLKSAGTDAALITETAPLMAQPDEKGKKIKTVKVNELVDVLAIGQESRSYEELYGKWIQVKDKNKKIGFIFSENLMTGKHLQLTALKKAGYKQARGWLRVKTKVLELSTLPWDELLKEKPKTENTNKTEKQKDEFDISECFPRKGQFVPINAKLTHEGKLYYHVQTSPVFNEEEAFDFIPDPPKDYDYQNCYSANIEGWVLAKNNKLIDNFYKYSKKSADDIVAKVDPKLLALVVKQVGPHLNVRSLSIEGVDLYNLKTERSGEKDSESENQDESDETKPVTIETTERTEMADDDEAFFIISGYQGPKTMFQPFGYSIVKGDMYKNSHRYLVKQTKESFRFLGDMPYGDLIDLNNDANPELVIIEQNRGGSYVAVYTFTPKGFKEVKGIEESHVEMGEVSLVAPYILMKEYDGDKGMRISSAFEYRKGKMRKVSKKKLKALRQDNENTSG